MSKPNILILWSNYYKDLSKQQLELCINQLSHYEYTYQIEPIEAGTYEIPAVMRYYHQHHPFDGYLPLSLLLKGKTDHYEFIWEHVKACFTQFALEGLIFGNGIISASSMDVLRERVEQGERVEEAINALDYLIRLRNKLDFGENSDLMREFPH
jgi:6,7-dimethyl-8-ribityllumazine synthase